MSLSAKCRNACDVWWGLESEAPTRGYQYFARAGGQQFFVPTESYYYFRSRGRPAVLSFAQEAISTSLAREAGLNFVAQEAISTSLAQEADSTFVRAGSYQYLTRARGHRTPARDSETD